MNDGAGFHPEVIWPNENEKCCWCSINCVLNHSLMQVSCQSYWFKTQKPHFHEAFSFSFAVRTGLEPATHGVTGRYSNQLNYRTIIFNKPYLI
jgi:hypothetical protein